MNVLYIGELGSHTTSRHRCDALQRLGHHVKSWDPSLSLAGHRFSKLMAKIHYRTGYRACQHNVMINFKSFLAGCLTDFDVCWVNGGELFGSTLIDLARSRCRKIILYNNDDPTGRRDGRRFDQVLRNIGKYDLCATVRNCTAGDFSALGAKNVLRVMMSYDEVCHSRINPKEINPKFHSDIAFIGTWMRGENRDLFLCDLIEAGLNVAIWGNRWDRSPVWHKLTEFYRGAALTGNDYCAAIGGAKICLGMLSKGNRDEHTTRSFEIPYAGGLLCAERTAEHLSLFEEGEEAVFWGSSGECVVSCNFLLSDDSLREKIRMRGLEKVRNLGVGNEDVCGQILDSLK